jgi:hypothetical protein
MDIKQEAKVSGRRENRNGAATFIANSTALLVSLLAAITLYGCGLNSNSELATEQLPDHMQSTEGRVSSAQGLITTRNGFYYLSPVGSTTNSAGWLRLDKQQYVKQFAGHTVKVCGFFNYDSNSIRVLSIQAVDSGESKSANKNLRVGAYKPTRQSHRTASLPVTGPTTTAMNVSPLLKLQKHQLEDSLT